MIARLDPLPAFDLNDWLTSVLIDSCDLFGDPTQLLAQLRAERMARTHEKIESLAREIVSAGIERGWLSLVELKLGPDTHPSEDALAGAEEVRVLSPSEAFIALESGSLWVGTGRKDARVLALSCTREGERHLDSLDACYD
ncbi:MAG: hypothetical protein ACO4BJ_11430 [Planctomycetota bacterium]